MKRTLLRACTTGIFLLMFFRVGYSQSANPLAPPLPLPRVGIEAGLTLNQQSGSFQSDCGCDFTSGSGNGVTISAIGEKFLTEKWEFMGKISYRLKGMTANTPSDTDESVLDTSMNKLIQQPVPLNQQATAKITYISIVPMIRYNVYRGLFVAAGPALGFVLSSDLRVQESFAQSGYSFSDGGTVEDKQPEGPIQNITSFSLGLDGQIGYTFPISENLFFVPAVSFEFPLTTVQSGTDWKIMTYQITGAVEWSIHL